MGNYTSTAVPPNPEKKLAYTVEFEISNVVQVEDIITVAQAAGDRIMEIYNGESSSWKVQVKTDESPLTFADTEANRLICAELQRLTPHVPIISEENKQVAYEVRKNYQYFWMVDPLDGTREFLKHNGQFTVNIALIQGSVPVLGVVHVPAQGKTYWSVQGKGAYVRHDGIESPVRAAAFRLEDSGLILVGSSSHLSPATEEFANVFRDPQFKQLGSSLKLLMVAEGTAHVYPRLAPTCEWDTAAADAIVREAGGIVLQAGKCASTGEALEDWKDVLTQEAVLEYNKPDLLNPFFVVFGRRVPSSDDRLPADEVAPPKEAAAALPAPDGAAEPPAAKAP